MEKNPYSFNMPERLYTTVLPGMLGFIVLAIIAGIDPLVEGSPFNVIVICFLFTVVQILIERFVLHPLKIKSVKKIVTLQVLLSILLVTLIGMTTLS